jgi:hypothetical protein
MAANDRWIGGAPVSSITATREAGSQRYWGQGVPHPGLDFDAQGNIFPLPATIAVTGNTPSWTHDVSRFYTFDSTAPYSPATYKGAWDDTSQIVGSKYLNIAPKSGAGVSAGWVSETSTSNEWDVLCARFVSPPLAAQTILGNVYGFLSASVNPGTGNFVTHLHLYVTQGDSDAVRGTLLTDYCDSDDNYWPGGWAPFSIPATALTPVTVLAGDRIVLEYGFRARNTSATQVSTMFRYGADPIADDVTSVADAYTLTGWLEFSNKVFFTPAAQLQVSQLVAETVGAGTADLLVSQLVAEAATYGVPETRASQLTVETLGIGQNIEVRVSHFSVDALDKVGPLTFTPAPAPLAFVGNQLLQEFRPTEVLLALAGNASPNLFVTLPLWPQPGSLSLRGNTLGSLMIYQWAIPIADVIKGSFVPSTGVDLYPCINDYEEPDDSTYIEAPTATAAEVELSPLNLEDVGDTAEIIVRIKRD